MRLYEGQTRFDLIYGTVNVNSQADDSQLTVGVMKNNTSYTSVGCDTTGGQSPPVSTGQLLAFSVLPCVTATPTNTPLVSDTPTNTATPTNTPDPCAPVWSVVSSPNPGTDNNFLYGVAVVSANDVWAVGYYLNGGTNQTLIEHWDGTSWSVVSSPNVGTGNNDLNGVAVVSATDVWAVGSYNNGSGDQTLVEHWNGTAWSVVSSPNPGTTYDDLGGVAVVSTNDVWAVGSYSNSSGGQTLVEHWNGTSWSVVASPNPTTNGSFFYAVAAVSVNDVWAVGFYYNNSFAPQTLVEHWNGTSWSVVSSPNVGTGDSLFGVAAVSANDVWAVGYYANGGSGVTRTLVEHWNGSSWSVVSSPNVGTGANVLNGVAVASANDVWAVGSYSNSSGALQTLVEHWNGTSWSVVSSPNMGAGDYLFGVAVVSATDVWAVGDYGNGGGAFQTLVEHWNGTAWSVVSSPNVGKLRGVAAVSANDVWAVGGTTQTLVEHYVYPCGTPTNTPTATPPAATPTNTPIPTNTPTPCPPVWSVVSSPNVGTGDNVLNGVAVVSATDVWAVGYYFINSFTQQTLIEHWNGTSWSVVESPPVGPIIILNAVAVVSSNDVWAVGYNNSCVPECMGQTLIEHWNGTVWSVVPSPNPGAGDNALQGVAVVSANDVWAVGSYQNVSASAYLTLVEHWNGTAWSVVPSPNVGTNPNQLYGVGVVSANNVWAVGYRDYLTLVEHWNGTAWSVVPSPNGDGDPPSTGWLKRGHS